MTRTVDLVIVGMTAASLAAAIDAAGHGERVLVVNAARNTAYCRALRRSLKTAGHDCVQRVSVLTGVEVVWVEGTGVVEVVLVRQLKTGRLIGINTGAVLLTLVLPTDIIAPMIRAHVRSSTSE